MSKSATSISPFSSPSLLLSRLVRLTSTIQGLDATLMLAQYTSPLIIALLLRLASFRAKHPRVRFSLPRGGGNLKVDGGFGLVRLAEGWGKAAGSVSEARVIMRAFGLLPIIQWLFALHPKPVDSLLSIGSKNPFKSEKALPTLQALSLLLYYPLEHLYWLAGKGVIPLGAQGINTAILWSVRFWALYVMLKIYELRNTYFGLLSRTRKLKVAKPEATPAEAQGFELEDKDETTTKPALERATTDDNVQADKVALKKDWDSWKNSVLVNSGYAPLTIHWSTPGGLWTSPLITGLFGSMAAVGQLTAEWRKGDP